MAVLFEQEPVYIAYRTLAGDIGMQKVSVIGGGMVGVSCALYLQQKGYQVTLIEKNDFGLETSFGNAGVISRGSIIPLNNPKLWSSLPKYLTNRHPAVRYNPLYLLRHLPWLAQFLTKATDKSCLKAVAALDSLIAPSLAEHKKLLQASGISHRLRENGWLKLYRQQSSFDNGVYERQLLSQHDVAFQCLNSQEIQDLEPGLKPIFSKALWVTDTASVDNPGLVVKVYAQLFQQQGGLLIRDNILKITPDSDDQNKTSPQSYNLTGELNSYACDQLVIATGPWANELLKPFGATIPLCYERGYHQHYNNQGAVLTRPFHDVDASYVMTPTDLGLRVTTGSELNERTAPANTSQLTQILPRVEEAFALGKAQGDLWSGSRPSTPDAIPIIGSLTQHPKIWLALGHQHIGFSTGPMTGQLIAEMIAQETTTLDPRPFSPQRFGL